MKTPDMSVKKFSMILTALVCCLLTTSCGLNAYLSEDSKIKEPRIGSVRDHNALSGLDNTARIITDQGISLPEPKDEHERLGDIHFRQGKLEMAYVDYDRSLQANPMNAGALLKKGLLFTTRKMHEKAIETFQAVLEIKPDEALAYQGLGQAYFYLKKYDDSIRNLERALALRARLWKPHNFLGIIYNYQGQYKQAIVEFKAALLIDPTNGMIYNNLGLSYSLMGDNDKAVRAFRESLKYLKNSKSDSAKVYNNLGLVLAKLGRYDDAMDAFRRSGDEAQAYNNLGCVLMMQGDLAGAASYFEKAIERKPEFYVEADENLRKAKAGMVE